MEIHTSSPSPAENRCMPPPVGFATPSLPRCCGEVPTPPPCPTGVPHFMGANAADLAAPWLLTDHRRARHHAARERGDHAGHTHAHAGQSRPSRPKPAVGWAAMAFRPSRCNRPLDHRELDIGPDSAQQPVNSFSNIDSFKYSQKNSSNIRNSNKFVENSENTK
jgi:hypothetical protein